MHQAVTHFNSTDNVLYIKLDSAYTGDFLKIILYIFLRSQVFTNNSRAWE